MGAILTFFLASSFIWETAWDFQPRGWPVWLVIVVAALIPIAVGVAGVLLIRKRPGFLRWAGIGLVAAAVMLTAFVVFFAGMLYATWGIEY